MKKFLTILVSTFCFAMATHAQSVSVNTDGSTADPSSILDVKSTTKGMLVPRMTTAQRTTIVAPANGLLVYDTDTKSFWYYNGTMWTNISGSGDGNSFTLPYDATVNLAGNAFRVANTNGNSIEGSSTNGSGIYAYSENNSGVNANSTYGFGLLASSTQSNAIRAFSGNANPTIKSSNTTGIALDASSSNDNGILGTSSAASKAGVRGEATGSSGVGVFGTATATNGYGVRGVNTSGTGVSGFSNIGYGILASSNTGVGLRTSSTSGNALEVFGKLKIYGNAVFPQNGAVLTSDAEGNATWKLNQVAFRARGAGTISDFAYLYLTTNVEEYDYSNGFNTANGEFTVPVTGVYSFGTHVQYSLNNDADDNIEHAEIQITVIRGGVTVSNHTLVSAFATFFNGTNFSYARSSVSGDLKLLAGDIVKLRGFQDNSADVTVSWNGTFFGHLVFPD